MRFPGYITALLLLCLVTACATRPPRFRNEALAKVQQVKMDGGESLAPAEFASVLQAFSKGEALLSQQDQEGAERYFYLTLLKGALLEQAVQHEDARRKEAALRAEEQKRVELERRARQEEERLAQARAQATVQKEAAEVEHKKAKPPKEHLLVNSYTVKRGESLPLIASHPEVYSDRNLWPVIYRANRDQIRDPRHIWPGQVLRVPRNLGRDDLAEARRYSSERPLH